MVLGYSARAERINFIQCNLNGCLLIEFNDFGKQDYLIAMQSHAVATAKF